MKDTGKKNSKKILTAEGRKTNASVRTAIIASVIILVAYVCLKFIRAFWWLESNRKSVGNGKLQRESVS